MREEGYVRRSEDLEILIGQMYYFINIVLYSNIMSAYLYHYI